MVEREFTQLEFDLRDINPLATPITSMGVARRFLLVAIIIGSALISQLPENCSAQWRPLADIDGFVTYFIDLPGPPRIGFEGIEGSNGLFKTTDGGYTWRQIHLPQRADGYIGFINDIVFKDSLTGWMSIDAGTYKDTISPGVCLKTTDGGETWVELSSTDNLAYTYSIYYDKKSGGLFLATEGGALDSNLNNNGWLFASWDEGATWVSQAGTNFNGVEYGGFAFTSDDSGILTSCDADLPSWYRTIDAGITWNAIAMDSLCWQPLAIKGTQTYFANTFDEAILRTDDSWNSWTVLYKFPTLPIDLNNVGPLGQSTSCIRGDLNSLIVQTGSGCYRSTDQGISWKYLCGPGNKDLYDGIRFYVKDNIIYAGAETDSTAILYMMNLDSLNVASSNFAEQFPDGSKRTSVSAGSNVTVNYVPLMDTLVGIDSVMLAIHYDTASLLLNKINIPSPWSILDSSLRGNVLYLLLTDTAAEPLPSPILQLTFGTFLNGDDHPLPPPSSGGSSAKVYLDSVHLYGHRLNCDCAVQSILTADTSSLASSIDSVEIDFTGCGDSILLAAMQGQPPFSIVSIQPNPAQKSIAITVSGVRGPG